MSEERKLYKERKCKCWKILKEDPKNAKAYINLGILYNHKQVNKF